MTNPNHPQILSIMECPVCYEVLRPPIRLCENSHAFCNDCHKKLEENRQDPHASCPLCRAPFQPGPSHLLEIIYDHLEVPCKFSGDGCTLVRHGSAMKSHEPKCKFRTRECPKKCDGCDWEGPLTSLTRHYIDNHT